MAASSCSVRLTIRSRSSVVEAADLVLGPTPLRDVPVAAAAPEVAAVVVVHRPAVMLHHVLLARGSPHAEHQVVQVDLACGALAEVGGDGLAVVRVRDRREQPGVGQELLGAVAGDGQAP